MTNQAQNPNDQKDYLSVFKFCPKCGGELKPKEHDKQVMPTCVSEECSFVFWQNAKPCVVAIILNNAGHTLMTVRGMEPDKGKLDLPGGFVMLNEDPEDAVIRETKEEVGVNVEVLDFVGVEVDKYYYQGYFETTLVIGYLASIVSGEPYVADRNEIGGIEWVDPDDFEREKIAFSCNEKFLEKTRGLKSKFQSSNIKSMAK